jgi:hypothetical protein
MTSQAKWKGGCPAPKSLGPSLLMWKARWILKIKINIKKNRRRRCRLWHHQLRQRCSKPATKLKQCAWPLFKCTWHKCWIAPQPLIAKTRVYGCNTGYTTIVDSLRLDSFPCFVFEIFCGNYFIDKSRYRLPPSDEQPPTYDPRCAYFDPVNISRSKSTISIC